MRSGVELKVVKIKGSPDVVWLNRSRRRLYCAVGRPGLVEVIDADAMTIVEEIETEEGAHTIDAKIFVFRNPSERFSLLIALALASSIDRLVYVRFQDTCCRI